jgi:xanthine dehydrogenase YagS FAD-binding subunit
MQAFQYANPTTLAEATKLLGSKWGEVDVLAGGTDQISLMKDMIHTPKLVVNIKNIKELGGIAKAAGGIRIGATVTLDELATNALVRQSFPSLVTAALGVSVPAASLLVLPPRLGADLAARESRRESLPCHLRQPERRFRERVQPGPGAGRAGRQGEARLRQRPARSAGRAVLRHPLVGGRAPAAAARNATYEVRQKEALDWPLAAASVALKMKGSTVESARIVLGHVAPTPWVASQAEQAIAGKAITEEAAEAAGKAATTGATPLSLNGYKVQLAKVAVKRALLAARGRA